MCPPGVGTTIAPSTNANRNTLPPGGHIGPPLREMGRMVRNDPTIFCIFSPLSGRKVVCFTATLKNPFMHCVGISS